MEARLSSRAVQAMTLHEYPDVEQGSEQWHALRRGIVTASTVHNLITSKTIKPASNDNSRALTLSLVAERITGYTDPTYQSFDMMRGVMDEPIARDLYSKTYAPVTETGFMIWEDDETGLRIGYSPDGLVGDDGLIEVKSRRQKTQLSTVLSGQVPIENMAQLQCGLLVSGRKWIDYCSYSGGMPFWTKRVYADMQWLEAIVAAVEDFESTAADMVNRYVESTIGLPMTERIEHFADIEV